MVRSGDVIEHPISGETMIFLRTPEETGGELLQIELIVIPGGRVAGEHIHPRQEERFYIRRGEMTIEIDGDRRVLHPGDEAIVPPGTRHVWWNSGDGELNAIVEFRPGGRFADFITTYFGLAKTGQVDENGFPGVLQSAVTLHEYRDTTRMTSIPEPVQKYVLPVVAAFGRMLGLRPDYPYPRRSRVLRGMEIWRPQETPEEIMVG